MCDRNILFFKKFRVYAGGGEGENPLSRAREYVGGGCECAIVTTCIRVTRRGEIRQLNTRAYTLTIIYIRQLYIIF